MTVNVLVLNFDGKDLLEKYLPSIERAVRRSRHECRLGIVDNGSQDGSVEFLRNRFPDVRIFEAKENRVLCSYNDVAVKLDENILIFMNNDIQVDENFVDPLVEPFDRSGDIFFVTPRCLSPKDGSYEGNKTKGMIRRGVYWSSALYPGYELGIGKPGPTMQGGFGAFDRKKFLELGGYDDLYLPGRLEDADICFRAYKRGWKCLYEPASVVYHEGGVSFKKRFGNRGMLVINWRNTFLFMIKNLSDRMTLVKFLLWLPFQALYALIFFKPEFIIGLFKSLPLLKEALRRRQELKRSGHLEAVPDREIFDVI